MNVFDRVVEAVDPVRALERQKARFYLSGMRQIFNSGYSDGAASRTKSSLAGWNASSGSPQEDIDLNLSLLRKRSRSLVMNAPVARAAVNVKRKNCVGRGLQVKSKIDYEYLGISKEEAVALQKNIQREFNFWADSHFCDCTGLNNFYEMQQIAFSGWMVNGDSFALPVYRDPSPNFPYRLCIRLLEADRVSTPESYGDSVDLEAKNKANGNRIYNGVEIDANGTVQAYHICNAYPDSYERKKWVRIPAWGDQTGNPNVLHIFNAERAEQYRGVPMLAPVVESIKQLTRYTEAEIMAAVINGMFAVMIKTEGGSVDAGFRGADEGNEGTEGRTVGYDEDQIRIGNGTINYLKPGESVDIVDAKRPNVSFDFFVSSMCKFIGAALDIPYEELMQHFGSSYSASRAALMEAWKSFDMLRFWFIADFCQPVFELFLSEAVASGRLICPGFFLDPMIRHAYCRTTWSGPAPGQLDPVKEAEGAGLRVQNGFSTREKESIEINGTDFDENIAQLELENQKMQEAFAYLASEKEVDTG